MIIQEAGESGDPSGLQKMGDYSRAGRYIEPNSSEALAAYEKAAAAGDVRSYARIADMQLDGSAGTKNPMQAIAYFNKAKKTGFASAERSLLTAHINDHPLNARPA